MDRKSIFVLVASLALILLWTQLADRMWPPAPAKPKTNVVASATNQISAVTNAPPSAVTNMSVAVPTPEANEIPEQLVQVENTDSIYSFTSRGGGIKLVELKEYPAVVSCRKEDNVGYASVNSGAPVPIMALSSADGIRSDDVYQLQRTGSVLTAERRFPNGLVVTKVFRIASNHLVSATVRLQNQSAAPMTLSSHEWTIGTSGPSASDEDETTLGIYWSKGDSDEHVEAGWFANRTLMCFPGTPRSLYVGGMNDVAWGAVHNQFLTAALVPKERAYQITARQIALPSLRPSWTNSAQNMTNRWLLTTNDLKNAVQLAGKLTRGETPLAKYIQDRMSPAQLTQTQPGPSFNPQVLVEELNRIISQPSFYADNQPYFSQFELSPRSRRLIEDQPRGENVLRMHQLLFREAFVSDMHPAPVGYQAALSYAPVILAPQQIVEREFHIYAGPREYNTLARLGTDLKTNLDAVMGYSGFFGFFAKVLLLSMNGLHAMGLSYALAIIAITVIIKLLFWPLTNASTKSMKRMSALQPEMKKLQEKYKDDPAKMNRKLMEFMKEHKVSPLGGCLPMLLQLPVFFGFFTMIRSAIELRGARFLWVCDLSKPDTLFSIPGLGVPFNLLPLLMGVTMLWQARLTPPSPGMDPAQQKIMRYMPLMFLVILYNFSAGLTLYWTVQNLLTIAQMKLTKAKDVPAAPASPVKAKSAPPPRKKN